MRLSWIKIPVIGLIINPVWCEPAQSWRWAQQRCSSHTLTIRVQAVRTNRWLCGNLRGCWMWQKPSHFVTDWDYIWLWASLLFLPLALRCHLEMNKLFHSFFINTNFKQMPWFQGGLGPPSCWFLKQHARDLIGESRRGLKWTKGLRITQTKKESVSLGDPRTPVSVTPSSKVLHLMLFFLQSASGKAANTLLIKLNYIFNIKVQMFTIHRK